MAATDLPPSTPAPQPDPAAGTPVVPSITGTVTLPSSVLNPLAPVAKSPASRKVVAQTAVSFAVTILLGVAAALTPQSFAFLGPVFGPLLYALVVAGSGYATGWLIKDPIRDVGVRAIAEDAANTAKLFVGRHFADTSKHVEPQAPEQAPLG